jgi:hypothetical protein
MHQTLNGAGWTPISTFRATNAEESRALRWGLRFPTALCLALVITGLALQSAALVLALAPVWLLAVGLLFAFGESTAALILGGVIVAFCGLVTTTHFCVPSTLLGIWSRRRVGAAPAQAN